MHLPVPDTRRTREALGLLVIAVLALAFFAWPDQLPDGRMAVHLAHLSFRNRVQRNPRDRDRKSNV